MTITVIISINVIVPIIIILRDNGCLQHQFGEQLG